MNLRDVTLEDEALEVSFRIEDECTSVRGNALVSGDAAFDRAAEDEILARLDSGDRYAWFCAIVEVSWHDFHGIATLGCCTYESEDAFKADAYYTDMISLALDDLNANIRATATSLMELETK